MHSIAPRRRLTKVICTLGPSSHTEEQLRTLIASGMSIARLNLSHGNTEAHRETIRCLQALNKKLSIPVGILLDTKGCEIRTGDAPEPIEIREGQEVLFSPHEAPGSSRTVIHVNYDGFAADVLETDRILIDNGALEFSIVAVEGKTVIAKAKQSGSIGSRRHINLPGADIDLPSITPKDWEDLAMGIDEGADFVALSFVRDAKDVEEVRTFIQKNNGSMRIIAKIETQQAVNCLSSIIAASDGIMVARGDLGAEIPFERIPAIQDRIVQECRTAGKPVIVATHMLESMIQQPMPTRAEATDVAHAAMSRADTTMLSGETATGKFPALTLETMNKILVETESHLPPPAAREVSCALDEREARAEAAVMMSVSLRAKAIVVFTSTGSSAQLVSKYRPVVPVFSFTESAEVQRWLQICYGVSPLRIAFSENPETTIINGFDALLQKKFLHHGDRIILVSDTLAEGKAHIGTVQVRSIP